LRRGNIRGQPEHSRRPLAQKDSIFPRFFNAKAAKKRYCELVTCIVAAGSDPIDPTKSFDPDWLFFPSPRLTGRKCPTPFALQRIPP
jgi:hypothetical protein